MSRSIVLKIFIVIQFLFISIVAQQSLDIYGNYSNLLKSNFRLNSFEGNSLNYNKTMDWEIGVSFATLFTKEPTNNIHLAFISKRLGNHYVYARYSPGFKKLFTIGSDSLIVFSDSARSLTSELKYEELFGLGYSYQFSHSISAGISVRYFNQNYSQENVYFYFSDSTNSLVTSVDNYQKNSWVGDIGISYKPLDNLLVSLSSLNLFILSEGTGFTDTKFLELRTDKGVSIGIEYLPFNNLYLLGTYETSTSFVLGFNYQHKLFAGKLALAISLFHDKYQFPYIAGYQFGLNYSFNSVAFSISSTLYSNNRNQMMHVKNLYSNAIHSITNNQFSYSNVVASVNLALNFKRDKKAKILSIDKIENIFPIISEEYISNPFAVATVENISNETVKITPSCSIFAINDEIIYSPSVSIAPNNKATVPFFILIDESKIDFNKQKIEQVNFYISTNNDDIDDEIKKPILIKNRNSWNSKVKDLKYFVKYDFTNANKTSKQILNKNKSLLDSTSSKLKIFQQCKILFNSFSKDMQYVSDPRSSSEYVQLPSETIEVKGGDCDDLSVAYSAMLESIGIETAFVDYKSDSGISHVNILINTKLSPSEISLITQNDKKIFLRKNSLGIEEIWIPIETTSLTNFDTAWKIGANKFNREAIDNFGLIHNRVQIHNVY